MSEVDLGWREVIEAFVIVTQNLAGDELANLGSRSPGSERPMPAFDLALGLWL